MYNTPTFNVYKCQDCRWVWSQPGYWEGSQCPDCLSFNTEPSENYEHIGGEDAYDLSTVR